jgi:hypothetical protein
MKDVSCSAGRVEHDRLLKPSESRRKREDIDESEGDSLCVCMTGAEKAWPETEDVGEVRSLVGESTMEFATYA